MEVLLAFFCCGHRKQIVDFETLESNNLMLLGAKPSDFLQTICILLRELCMHSNVLCIAATAGLDVLCRHTHN